MEGSKIATLLNKLHEKTTADSVNWAEHPFEDAFQLILSSSSVVIHRKSGNVTLELRNNSGTIVDSITVNPISTDGSEREKLQQLYQLAKRRALGTDKLIDMAIAEIDDDIPF